MISSFSATRYLLYFKQSPNYIDKSVKTLVEIFIVQFVVWKVYLVRDIADVNREPFVAIQINGEQKSQFGCRSVHERFQIRHRVHGSVVVFDHFVILQLIVGVMIGIVIVQHPCQSIHSKQHPVVLFVKHVEQNAFDLIGDHVLNVLHENKCV
jgi:hypothetical protein